MKAVWQGSISFGLVNIPIALYTAVKAHPLGFTLLCSTCNTPISYKRWCNHCKKEVAWENVVKGLKLKGDTYFVLTQENLKALKPLTTEALTIIEFVDVALINPIYFEKHYYIAPKKHKEKAYFLFAAALNKTQKAAVGTFVMKDKEHVCIISPYKHALLLTTLNYSYEINDINNIETLDDIPKITTQEVSLAIELIDRLTKKTFDMKQFKDTFALRLKTFLSKHGRKKLVSPKTVKKKAHGSLVESLHASLARTKKVTRSRSVKK